MTKCGFSRRYLEDNVNEFLKEGWEHDRALRAAKTIARKFFKKKYPDKPYPEYMEESDV